MCGLWIFGEEDRKQLLYQLDEYLVLTRCILKTIQKPRPSLNRASSMNTVTLEEIWTAVETMAPHPEKCLSEVEFLARFQILVQV